MGLVREEGRFPLIKDSYDLIRKFVPSAKIIAALWLIYLIILVSSLLLGLIVQPTVVLSLILAALVLIVITAISWPSILTFFKRKSSYLDRYEVTLRSGKEVVYRNMDAQNIIDAFEKGAGIFYMVYKEADEEIFIELEGATQIIRKKPELGSIIMEMYESMVQSIQSAVNVNSAMSAFFLTRIEDELLDKSAFDALKIYYKRQNKELHAIKDGGFDLPIWEIDEILVPTNEEMSKVFYKNKRKVGLLVVFSGLDVPKRIVEDVKVARTQHKVLSRIKNMKNIKIAGFFAGENKYDKLKAAVDDIANQLEEVKVVDLLPEEDYYPQTLDEAIEIYFSDLPANERAKFRDSLIEAIEQVVERYVASQMMSYEDFVSLLAKSLKNTLKRYTPDFMASQIIRKIEDILLTEKLYREMGRNLKEQMIDEEGVREAIIEAFKEVSLEAVKNVKRRSSKEYFHSMIEQIKASYSHIKRRIREIVGNENNKGGLLGGLKGNINRCIKRYDKKEDVLEYTKETLLRIEGILDNIEFSLRNLERHIVRPDGILHKEFIEDSGEFIEFIQSVRRDITKFKNKIKELKEYVDKMINDKSPIKGKQESQEGVSSTENCEEEIERALQELSSFVEDLESAFRLLSVTIRVVTEVSSIYGEMIERSELVLLTVKALEMELVETLNRLAKKDLRLYISSKLGNPLKKYYLKVRGGII